MQIIDLHCDTILHLMDQPHLNLYHNNLSVDIEKLQAGNALAQFFALYIDLAEQQNPLQYCLSMVDIFHREMKIQQPYIALALNYQDLLSNQQAGKISAFLTIEEGGALQGRLENLRNFYRLGVRLLTLTWNYPNEIGYPNIEEQYGEQGLTDFGKEVVVQMNQLGMIIDVSHLSDQGFYDVAALSNKPFVASHSNARAIRGHRRNLTDDMITLLAQKGGIMGINFSGNFLAGSNWSRVDDMVRHIKHIVKIGGIDIVALGTDFDGIEYQLEISHLGNIDKLIKALVCNGFTTGDIEKICYKNAISIIKECL
ncbi:MULTISPECIES: dipeptidase [Pelosinus]|uniref:Peptidase M19 renal dipeptidase n=1 Tax=Pelosinus fermentans B4 TaxID=1149862 RepID=I8RM60_9FIRM|nr:MULTISPECIES: dipeptidase [Pelosinus]EIW19830.1 peptidase M19 renal dipeptidase [Pelosinus fermentans B4]EIW21313.1 peptidase M19 renal dipeptidase [Pelosinus fermentans A11]OAM94984.1 Membrane dipeptidase [Pelosinus fermentans DSM 17108]SDR21544.1 membrane dipeptidase [Pelosinus fermentans]